MELSLSPPRAAQAVPSPSSASRAHEEHDATSMAGIPLLSECVSFPIAHRPEAVRHARQLVEALLRKWQVRDDAASSIVLVVSELVTNAVEHARPPLTLHVLRERTGRRVWVGMADGGPASAEGAWTSSCALGEHGRGLTIVDALAHAHGIHSYKGCTTHWARLPACA
ncbi:ATP-binding protein [Streptomyces sp. NPDC127084]|uniref:ATP-binding protein n=1 Tax=Streptomyces sp. NPDC127084 TaxID=3347133 RepID=UPI003651CA9E